MTIDELLTFLDEHRPSAGSDITDDTWLECSCGWDESDYYGKPRGSWVGWYEHMEAAARAAFNESTRQSATVT